MSHTQPAPRLDRRLTQRRPVTLRARIRSDATPYLSCTVRNISAMGAAIELDYEAVLPTRFRLQIPDDLFEVDCVLKHARGTIVGVAFVSHRAEALARYG